MYPGQQRINELRERFGVKNGQFWGYYRFKNLNWYLCQDDTDVMDMTKNDWFLFGDVRDEHIPVLMACLEPNETLILGWKDLSPDLQQDQFFSSGGGIWLVVKKDGVVFDKRRDHPQDFEGF